jgi:radical SAM superfamily enzyme YgiQ (UPF0313 family)
VKICLIQPTISRREINYRERPSVGLARWLFNHLSPVSFGGGNKLPPLALLTVAALTPPEYQVTVVDEEVERLDFEMEVDLVGISILTTNAYRGYEIARRFRDRGVRVVLGGIHATVLPEEAARHGDAVVIGEAEGVWNRVLADAGNGSLKPFYRAEAYCDMKGMPHPRRDLVSPEKYISSNIIQITRGCPNSCSFCSVHAVAGRKYRFRPVEEVMEEIDSFDNPLVLIHDDNIVGDPEYAKELFRAMIPRKVYWVSQASLNLATDPELMDLAVRSGMKVVLIGFESVYEENIRSVGKSGTNRVADYLKAIDKLRDRGVCVSGTFILGLENDGPGVFKKTADFIRRSGMGAPIAGILTPYPGSSLFTRMKKEGKLLHTDWSRYSHTMGDVVFRPHRMTPEELEAGRRFVGREIFSMRSVARRLAVNRKALLPTLGWNFRKRGIFYR